MTVSSTDTTFPSRRAIRQLSAARLVSAAGSLAARIALVYVIYERTDSSTWVSIVLLADLGVTGALGPISGWIGDRVDRRRVMVASEIGAGAVYLCLVFAHAPWVMAVGTLLAAIANAPFMPASSAAIPNIAAQQDLRWANSQLALSRNVALVIGPLVGGWLVAASGIQLVFVVNGLSFLASAILITRIDVAFRSRAGATEGLGSSGDPETGGFRVGYRIIARHRVVRTLTVALGLAHFTFGLAMVADPALADEFNAGSFGYAVLYTGWGAVAIVGAWLAGRSVPHDAVAKGIIAGLGLMAASCIAIAVLPAFWAVVVFGSLGGLGSGAVFPLTAGLMQEHTDDHVRARVFGATDTVEKMVFATGMLLGGPAVRLLGGQGAYGVTGALIGVATMLSLRLPAAVDRENQTRNTGTYVATAG